ncbi:hypothetical protein NDU88_003717 [Pleurodeles waltl]|uniref:Uncharacterized protein n=1 Tax=Pleurodeles waltl TaxID=8319 RepID=A0AAV7QDY3_PLEWA|nr:hypothetical protein NDU88_003717 [Pleurodeles waltl]
MPRGAFMSQDAIVVTRNPGMFDAHTAGAMMTAEAQAGPAAFIRPARPGSGTGVERERGFYRSVVLFYYRDAARAIRFRGQFALSGGRGVTLEENMAYYAEEDEYVQDLPEIAEEQHMEERLVEALDYHVQDSVNQALIKALKPFTKSLTRFGQRELQGRSLPDTGSQPGQN